MDVINNPNILDKLDDKAAITAAQRALRELDELLKHAQGSEARRRLERQRNVLLWQVWRRESKEHSASRPSGPAASRPRKEPTENLSAKGQQVKGQRLGEPSSSSAVSGGSQLFSGSARKVHGAQPQPPNTRPLLGCSVCMEDHPPHNTVTLACSHHCCRDCLNEIYKGATTDETRYPPRCCQPIPIEQSRPLLDPQVLAKFLDKQVEWETKDRIYCSTKACLRFIRPKNIRARDAKCPICGTRTCSKCKKAAHSSKKPCSASGQGTRLVLKVMEENKWRRCEGCKTGIEKKGGCNHTTCKCGKQFCYECGAKWKTCACEEFPDDPLILSDSDSDSDSDPDSLINLDTDSDTDFSFQPPRRNRGPGEVTRALRNLEANMRQGGFTQ